MNQVPGPNSDTDSTDVEQQDAVIAVALKRSLIVVLLLAAAGAALWWMTRPMAVVPAAPERVALPEVRTAPEQPLPTIQWTDITEASGIHFVHENGAVGEKLLPETMGGGCAFFDADNDGDQDLLLVNSANWPWSNSGQQSVRSALYENDGSGKFTDITEKSGLHASLYGMGAACGDFDNDGHTDVFLTGVGDCRLFRNLGGRFEDVTETAGVKGSPEDWSTCAGWLDYDRDHDLDLFVGQYVTWTPELDRAQDFRLDGGHRAYGRPQAFAGRFPRLYRNDGNGKFTDVAESAGLHVRNPATGVPLPKSLGATFGDLDEDGWPDILVANDTVQNLLFRNRGDGTFEEIGAVAGIAFDAQGQARGAMGIDLTDFRNDGTLGVAIGNFANEMTALYVSPRGQMSFTDEAVPSGLGPATRLVLTFGVLFLDADLDGRADIFAANGHLEDEINRVQASQHYEQPPQLFWNCGSESETEFCLLKEPQTGSDLQRPMVGRGAATADIDGDGDQDLIITATGAAPRLLRNDQSTGHHWLRVRLKGGTIGGDGVGALVNVTLPDGTHQSRQVNPTRSYLSQCELPITFGIGDAASVSEIEVRWPDASVQKVANPPVDQMITIEPTAK
ncbi:MAG: FG-GAP-like repeat-containing protein [Planctomyces sp.]